MSMRDGEDYADGDDYDVIMIDYSQVGLGQVRNGAME
jgi:hypothetical protein